ncbi:cathepsin L1-like [Megalops cyprinoides]|uniref:cathepsin L1-like n=1 Tax=Megalops cyprinoides TaxID=118141 RepID=UPI0018652186|nr:cathepsin L1-like [Megalops cyprinoides]
MEGTVVVLIVLAAGIPVLHAADHALDAAWEDWKSLHGKTYTEDSEGHRRMIWEENHRFIQQHNLEEAQGKHSYKLGMNHFGDLTQKEFQKMMLDFNLASMADTSLPVWNGSVLQAPTEVDWSKKGYVTPVKNQGRCGSCWAFSSTGALEGQVFKKTGKLISLSEQHLVDCSRKYGNHGCNGGLMDRAYKYIKDNGGIASEEGYPYKAKDESCKAQNAEKVATCTGYTKLRRGDEGSLRDAVASIGPVAVALNAGLRSFQFYKSGIYYDRRCSRRINHAVLAVGYGESLYETNKNDLTRRATKFWLLKNSWGTGWGNQGYMRLARDKRNLCGIANYSVYPKV